VRFRRPGPCLEEEELFFLFETPARSVPAVYLDSEPASGTWSAVLR